jgi:hypothetical protein
MFRFSARWSSGKNVFVANVTAEMTTPIVRVQRRAFVPSNFCAAALAAPMMPTVRTSASSVRYSHRLRWISTSVLSMSAA